MSKSLREPGPDRPRSQGRRTSRLAARARSVRITHSDGTVTTQPAYSPREADAIVRRGQKQPRQWDEVNSSKGGGSDHARST